jgi:purine-binding chemotaxis protein CheW
MNASVQESAGGDAQRGGQHLIFSLGRENFAVGILGIREIIQFGELTEMPLMPEAIRGVINLRGAVVPVIDLSARFCRGRTEVQRRTCVVILEVPGEEGSHIVGVLVDGVNEVIDITADQIEPPPSFGARLRTDFIAGMAKVDGRFVIVLDIARVLSLEEIADLEPVLQAAPAAGSQRTAALNG